MPTATKNPAAFLDYGFDWSLWLAGDTITTSIWTLGGGLQSELESCDGSDTTVWVSGGTPHSRATLVNTIETAAGRKDYRTITLTIPFR
jgi:hypothetical protein